MDRASLPGRWPGAASGSGLLLALASCGTMMVLMGDNVRYSLSGQVQSSTSRPPKGISDVVVSIDCPGLEKSVYQNRKGDTDRNVNYAVAGYWDLQACRIALTHPDYQPLTVSIGKEHLTNSAGLSLTYVVNMFLDPKAKGNPLKHVITRCWSRSPKDPAPAQLPVRLPRESS